MKCDLSDFCNNLLIPARMNEWFALPPMRGAVIGMPEIEIIPLTFGVLPMGASHAIVLAQLAHLELLRRSCLPVDERLLLDGQPLLILGRSLPSSSTIWC